MDQVAAKQRQIIIRAAGIALILATLAALFGRWPAALGVLAGCMVAILNFRLLALGIIKIMELNDPHAAQVQAVVRYIIRYAIMIMVVYSVSINPQLDLYATVVGLLLIKVVILGEAVITYILQQVQPILDPARWERGEN